MNELRVVILRYIFSWLLKLPVSEKIFCVLVSALFSPARTRVFWDKNRRLFQVSEGNRRVWVARRSRLELYNRGITRRLGQLFDEYGLERIPLAPGDWAVDVGANIGECSLLMLDSGAKIWAFEPDPLEFRALEANANGSWGSYPFALGNKSGKAPFFRANNRGDSSLFAPNGAVEGTVTVEVKTLSESIALQKTGPSAIRLLKVEAEGGEPEVLEGAQDILGLVEWVVVDAGFERGALETSTLPQVIKILEPLGFELVEIRPPRVVAIFHNLNLRNS